MPNTVTYKGHKDPSRTEYVAATAGGLRFPLGRKVEDVPDKVVKELEAMSDHEFTVTQTQEKPSGSSSKS